MWRKRYIERERGREKERERSREKASVSMAAMGAKKSKGSKSKRVTLKQKYKMIKKVREHHRKKRRDERRAVAARKQLGLKKPMSREERASGQVPSEWPFKEELMREVQANADMKAMMRERRKRTRQEERERQEEEENEGKEEEEMLDEDNNDNDNEYVRMMRRVPSHDGDNDNYNGKLDGNYASTSIKGDGSMRAFYKDFSRVVERSDVIIIVLDARDPQGTRCAEVEQFIRRSGSEKRIILLLNKIDLVPKQIVTKWLSVLRMELPAVAFKSSSDKSIGNGTGDCLGSETLLSILKNYARNKNMKVAITVGIVGLPNVGKSSLINSLKRTRAVNVGGTPGVTRAVQEVSLDKHVKLLDSPGIVFKGITNGGSTISGNRNSNGEYDIQATLRNAVKVEKVADPVAVATEIVRKCDAVHLQRIYKVQQFQYAGADQRKQLPVAERAERFLYLVASTSGLLRRGGVPDTVAAARMVLNDWNGGKIPYYTEPPESKEYLNDEAEIVQEWGAEFNLEDAIKNEKSLVIDALEDKKFTGVQKIDAGSMVTAPILVSSSSSLYDFTTTTNVSNNDVPELVPVDGNETQMTSMETDIGQQATIPMYESKSKKLGKMKPEAPSLKKRAAASQKSLYGNEGQYNPHHAREEKRKKKKLKKLRDGNDKDGDITTNNDSYDWKMYDNDQ